MRIKRYLNVAPLAVASVACAYGRHRVDHPRGPISPGMGEEVALRCTPLDRGDLAMSSGHTSRSGRGNRRARRGADRQRGPVEQNAQSHPNSAMLILSSNGRDAHASPQTSADGGDMRLDEELGMTPGSRRTPNEPEESSTGNLNTAREEPDPAALASADDGPAHEERAPDSESRPDDRTIRAGKQRPGAVSPGGRGPHERAQPYAPGMRTYTYPRTPREAPSERQGGAMPRTSAYDNAMTPDRGSSDDAPEPVGRVIWAEQSDAHERAPLRPETRGEVGSLIDELRALFEQDRTFSSQGGTTRCGICYLHFSLVELEYREAEGYYVCRACARSLGTSRLPMVRRQQRT